MPQFAEYIDGEFPNTFEVYGNYEPYLKEYSPEGNWRKGSFEVRRTDTGELLYSKLETGEHLVEDKPENQRWDAFVNKLKQSLGM